MKNLIAKLLKGDALTDEERSRLEAYDPDKAANDAAAAARKKAEGERDAARKEAEDLRKQIEDSEGKGKTENQKLLARIEKLEKEKSESDAKAAAMERARAIEGIRAKSGLKFVDGIDPDLLNGIFAKQFDGVDDLSDESAVSERIKSFRDANKGLILSEQGGGTGRSNQQPAGGRGTTANPWAKGTFNLTEQINLERTNPAEAARLKSEAEAADATK